MSNNLPGSRFVATIITLLGVIVVMIALDLWVDYSKGAGGFHVSIESIVLLLAAGGIGILLSWLYRERVSARALKRDLSEVRRESVRWRADSRILIEGLGAAIQQQFTSWELTEAEADVALLLLKGLSLKEVAALRETSDRTVREQARSVYRKAGLSGRSGLSAFFLEDLLLPADDNQQP